MRSPTARSLAQLRGEGMLAQVVEKFIPAACKRQDLFGFADLLAIADGVILAVQTTSTSNLASRQRKTLTCPGAALWLRAGGRIELHGWSKRGPRGKRKLWTLSRRRVLLVGGVLHVEIC